ncbi:MAG TPA: cupin domain-containing protein [Pyrinomonadaceae bacterium]
MQKVNLNDKLALINDHWNPRIAGELNGQHVKLVKFQGPFTWHHHENEDELFMVIKGRFRMDYRDEANMDQQVWIEEGELIIVPHGVEHCPVAEEECQVLLFEPKSTLNTGNIRDEFTKEELETV